MIGASELIEQLSELIASTLPCSLGIDKADYLIMTKVAGATRLLFKREDDARKVATWVPLVAGEMAPGLEIVQAVQPITASLSSASEAAAKALQATRNQPSTPLPPAGPMVMRARRSGLPAESLRAVGIQNGLLTNRIPREALHAMRHQLRPR